MSCAAACPTLKEPIRICITGAAGQIAYSLLYSLANGSVFGFDQPVILHLLDIAPMIGVLNGVVMELEDCSLPLLAGVVATADEKVGFKDVDYALMLGAMPRKEGMERKDLLAANVKIFKSQGQAINEVARKTVKVLVVGNPANTNALVCRHFAPSIPSENFSALTRLDHNRSVSQVALKLGVCAAAVKNVIVWGNHSNTQYPDLRVATVAGTKGSASSEPVPALKAINDDNWVRGTFVPTVRGRGGAVIAARKLSSAMSAAKAIADHIRDWHNGTPVGQHVSMAIISPGNYSVPAGLMFSYPVTVEKGGKWTIVDGFAVDDELRAALDATTKELVEERDMALSICNASN